jgi:hypothetical protein
MGWEHELAPLAVHTCVPTHDLGAHAADMAQHLVQPSHESHKPVNITLGGSGNVLNSRHLPQLRLRSLFQPSTSIACAATL